MKMFRVLLAAFVLLLVLPQAEAQRGGRSTSKRPNSSASRTKSKKESDFVSRLWYGAGGTANFASNSLISQFAIGLTPQVGYKFNEWLSAGPRVGATYNGIKGETDRGGRERVNLWNFTGSGFARARVSMFYLQPEFGLESRNNYFIDGFGRIAIDSETLQPAKSRTNDPVFLLGAGYNGSMGGMGSDIGIFYNILDDVDSQTSPITFRIMLTFGY